jgi:exodeoxyribonuclease-3
MKLVSWNVNGLRACVGKGFLDFFDEVGADVFCVQETKLQEVRLTAPARIRTVLELCREKGLFRNGGVFQTSACLGIAGTGIDEHDQEGRAITLDYGDFFLVNVYTPNSQDALMRLPYRMQWEDAFRDYVQKLDQSKPVILCGDLNVAHREIDLKNPKSNRHSAGFTDEEREKLTALLDSGFTDTFRFLYPDNTGAYTWWSYMNKARQNNAGWRIDYFLTSERLRGQIAQARIYSDILGSDHCP